MATSKHDAPAWLTSALSNPTSVFASPEDVVSCAELDDNDKIRVLRSWEYDAAELAVAEEEGMRGATVSLLPRILRLLDALNADEDVDAVAPTKHHGVME